MAEAVQRAGSATVLVDARKRYPASGILYSSDLVLTADHVVEREEDLKVGLPDGSTVEASLAGRDPGSDLALLKLSRPASGQVEQASGEPQVGQLVLALGRPTAEGVQASLGVISSIGGPVQSRRGAMIERYLLTDAIPYPGFSGGPLVDASGRILGINTSGLSRGSSIAIPISLAWSTAATLQQHGKIKRGFLGIRSQPVELPGQGVQALGREQASGLLIMGVEPNSPASAAGLMTGDILVGLAGNAVRDQDELFARLAGSVVGAPTPVEILRGGRPETITVTIGERR
jgi:S1-C subfamily serine protease